MLMLSNLLKKCLFVGYYLLVAGGQYYYRQAALWFLRQFSRARSDEMVPMISKSRESGNATCHFGHNSSNALNQNVAAHSTFDWLMIHAQIYINLRIQIWLKVEHIASRGKTQAPSNALIGPFNKFQASGQWTSLPFLSWGYSWISSYGFAV